MLSSPALEYLSFRVGPFPFHHPFCGGAHAQDHDLLSLICALLSHSAIVGNAYSEAKDSEGEIEKSVGVKTAHTMISHSE